MRINIKKPNIVRYVNVESVEPIGKEDVYNMEVKNHHNFSICGGFIVHNCMDASRYFVHTILVKSKAIIKDKKSKGLR